MKSSPCARCTAAAALLVAAMLSSPADAASPEQLYEPPPEHGETRLELNTQIALSRGNAAPQSAELFHGVSDRLALGVEIESEIEDGRLRMEEVGAAALVRLSAEDAPVEAAVLVQVGFALEGGPPQLETRLILERETAAWRTLGNLIVRRTGEKGEQTVTAAYSAVLERRLSPMISVGMEGSGQAMRLAGERRHSALAHFFGPSLTLAPRLAGEWELNVGLKYLRRVSGQDSQPDTLRLTAELSF